MTQYVYMMQEVNKVVPPQRSVLKNISLHFIAGAKIGVVGLNGAGKSTLLRIMAGVDREFDGQAIAKTGIRIGYLPQEPKLDQEYTVRQAVAEALYPIQHALKRLEQVYASYAEPEADLEQLAQEQAELEAFIHACDGHNLSYQVERAAEALHLPPWEAKIGQLSGGERRRVAICRLLLEKPEMLLLDEPTNHLDATSVVWLEAFLRDYPGTVVAITHDRYFLDNVAEWILELDRGEGIPWHGNYSSWLLQKQQRLMREATNERARLHSIQKELDWIQKQSKGRQAKNKARLARFDELSQLEHQRRNETNELFIPPGPRLGAKVLEVCCVNKMYGKRVLLQELSFTMTRGAIVGIIGPNGAGKSTLFRLLTGQEAPDSGEIVWGDTAVLVTTDQFRDALDDQKTVWEEISGGVEQLKIGHFTLSSRAYVGRFNFKGSEQQKRIGDLSGGERHRVQLAKALSTGGNVLLLDEPTNDLDVETLRALENALLEFPGCVLVISHDRWFLDRIATHILAYGDQGALDFYTGNFTEYEEWKEA